MKVNDELILKVIAANYNKSNSIKQLLTILKQFNLINDKTVNNSLKQALLDSNIFSILNIIIKDRVLVDYIKFYHNYYSFNDAVNKSIQIIKEREQIKKEIIASLIYPIILIVMTSFALLFISQYIVPQLVMLNPNTNQEYKMIIIILKYVPLLFISLIILIIISFYISLKLININLKKYLPFYLKISGVNFLIRYYTTLTLSLYLKEIIKNVPLSNDSIYVLKNQTNNIFIQYICDIFIFRLEKGQHIFKIISSSSLIQNDLKQTLLLANNSKQMSNLTDDYFSLKIDILKKRIKVFLAIFVPIIVSFIGVLLILMYLLIMFPVLDMSISL